MKKILSIIAVLIPSFASAQVITDVNSLTYKLTNLGNTFMQVLIAVAVVFIVYKVVRFIMSSDDKRNEYRASILWGFVGLVVIISVWGIVKIISNTFRTDTSVPTNQFPQVQYPQQVP